PVSILKKQVGKSGRRAPGIARLVARANPEPSCNHLIGRVTRGSLSLRRNRYPVLQLIGLYQVENDKNQGGQSGKTTQERDNGGGRTDGVAQRQIPTAIAHRGVPDGVKVSLEGIGKPGINKEVPHNVEAGNQ